MAVDRRSRSKSIMSILYPDAGSTTSGRAASFISVSTAATCCCSFDTCPHTLLAGGNTGREGRQQDGLRQAWMSRGQVGSPRQALSDAQSNGEQAA